MSSYEIARDRLESLRQRGLLDNPGPARSQPLIRQPPPVRPQPEQYGNTYSQDHEYPQSHNHPPARAPLLGRRPAPPLTGFAEYEEDQYENSYHPPEKRPLLEYDPNSERGFHETGRGFSRGRGLLSRGQGQHYSRGRGGISHSIVNQQADEYEGFDSVGYGLDSTVSGNENRGRVIIRGRGVNMRGRGGDTLGRGIGAGIRGIDTRGRGVNTRGRGVDTIGRGTDTIEGIDVPGRGFGANSRGIDTRGRGISTRGRGIETRGRGIDMMGRGIDTIGRGTDTIEGIDVPGRGLGANGKGIDTIGRGFDTRGRGIDTRGRGFDTRGRGIDTRGRGVDTRGRGIDTRGRGIDTRGRGIDTRGRGVDTRGRGIDTSGRGIDTSGRGIDTRGRGIDMRGRGIDTSGRGIDTRGRGIDMRGRGVDTRGRGIDTMGRGVDTRGRGIDTRGRGVDTRGRGVDTRGRGIDTRGRGFDTRGRGIDTRGRGFDTRGRGIDTMGRGIDTRGRGVDTRGRGSDRGRGISVRGKGTSNLLAGGGHAEESENLYTGNEEAKNVSDSSSKNVSVEQRTPVAKQDSTPSKTGTTEEKVQQKEENENTLKQTTHTPESVKPVTSKTPVQAKAGLGRGLAACLMNVAESSPGPTKEDESSSGGVDHKESSNTNKADGVDNSNKQPSTPDPSSKPPTGPSAQVSPLNKELVNSYCEPCKSFFSFAPQYQAHLKSEAHISKVKKSAAPEVNIVAKVKQSAEQTLVKHNQSKATSAFKSAGRDRPSGQGVNEEDSDSDGDDTRCKVCDMTFDDRGKYLRHTKGLMHTQKKIEYDKAKGSTKYDDVMETSEALDKPFAFGSGSSSKEKPWLKNQSQGFQSHTGYGAQKSHQLQKGYNAHTGYEAHRGYGDNTGYDAYTGYGSTSGYEADKGYGQTDEWWETEEHEQLSARGPAGMTRRMREAGITEEMLAESQMMIPKLDPGDRDLQPGDVGRLQFPDSYHCKLCDAKCTSAVTFQSHLAGAKHKNNVLSASMGNKIRIKKKGRSVTSLTRTSKIEELLNDYSIGECAVIGLDYITEFHTLDPRATILCVCNLCESKCDENTVASHVMGLKHKIKYMKEKHPVMYEHFKKFGGKKSQQTAFAEELAVQVMKQDGRGRVNVKVEVDSDEEETPEYKAQKEAEAAKTKEEELVLKQRLQQQMNQAIKRYAVPTMESVVKKHTGPGAEGTRAEGTSHQEEEDYSGRYQGHPREHDRGHEHAPASGRGHYPQDDRSHDLERGRYDNYPREHERVGGREARWPYDRDHPRGQGHPGYDARSRSPYMSPYQPKPQIDVMERRRLDDLVRRGLITETERKNMEQTKIAEMEKKHAESRPGPGPSQQTPGVGPSHRDNPEYLQFLADRQRKQEQRESLATGHHPQETKGAMGSEHQTFSGNRRQQLERKQTTKADKQEEAVPQIGELLSTLSSSMISSEDEAAVALQVSNALTQALMSYRLRASAAEVKKAGSNVPSGFPQESGSPGRVRTSQSTGPAGFTQSANPPYSSSPGPRNSHHPPHTAASGHQGYGIPGNARYDSQTHPKAYSHIQPVPTSEYQASIQQSGYQADSVAQPGHVQPSSQIPGHIQPRLPAHIQPSGVVQPSNQIPGHIQPRLPAHIQPSGVVHPSNQIPGHIQPRLPAHIQPSGAYQPQPSQQPGPVQPPTSTQSKLPSHIQTSTANLPSFGAQLPGHIQPSSSYQPYPIHQPGSSPIQPQLPGHIQQPGPARLPGHIQPSGLFQPPATGRGVQYPPMGQYSNFQPPLPSYEPPKPPPPPPPPK